MTSKAMLQAEVFDGVPRQLLIGGEWKPASDGATFEVRNPATGDVLFTVADANRNDALAALVAAVAAQEFWATVSPQERSDILYCAHQAVLDEKESLATLMTLEMGKSLAEARGEVEYSAKFLRWFAEEAVRIQGSHSLSPDGKGHILTVREPVGPSLLITPWNFPLAMGARKIGPAIAAGCTMVFKPAPQAPLSSLALARIFLQSGLPNGVLNVVTTTKASQIVEPLLRSGQIRKLSFTGSTAVGRILLAQCAERIVRTSMELGGNAPFIVFEDADLDVAVDAAIVAKMRNMGEACTAANRFFVHERIADAFTDRLVERLSVLRIGDGQEHGTDVGPLIDEMSLHKVKTLVDDAIMDGATVRLGGSIKKSNGYFYLPTVLTDLNPTSRILNTEIFGPVASIIKFSDEEAVIREANSTEWGLVGYIITTSLNRAIRVTGKLAVGMVGLNTGVVSNVAASFGGVKQSGLGREGGHLGIDEFLNHKYIAIPVT